MITISVGKKRFRYYFFTRTVVNMAFASERSPAKAKSQISGDGKE